MVPHSRPKDLLDRLIERFLRRRYAVLLLVAGAAGCATITNSATRLNESVEDANIGARFGRADVAMLYVDGGARDAYLKHHRAWGTDVRIVDVEVGGLEKVSTSDASVLVSYGWFRPDEGSLHTTVLRQKWHTSGGDAGWFLVDEERASGDLGLLGDAPAAPASAASAAPPHRSRWETTTITGGY